LVARRRSIAVHRIYWTLVVALLVGIPVLAGEDKEAAKLVQELGSPAYAARESAQAKLLALGPKAKVALIARLKDADAEIAQRCELVLKQIRAKQLQALLSEKGEWPGLEDTRFKEIVGDTSEARRLFAVMINDTHRAEVVESVAADPTRAASLYAVELSRVQAASASAMRGFEGRPASPNIDSPLRRASRQAVSVGDVVLVLFLGSLAKADGVADPANVDEVVTVSFSDFCEGQLKEPFRRLFVAWLNARRDPKAINTGLYAAVYASIPEALPVARRIVADRNAAASITGVALLVLGNHGTANDLPRLAVYREDVRVFEKSANGKSEIQVRDVATAASLRLRGQEISMFGFEVNHLFTWWVPGGTALKTVGYFETPSARDAALKKSWEWLDKQP
jgi:hypothetical protein